MIKQNLSGMTLIDKNGVRVNPNIHLGESDGYISGDILDANAVQGTVNLAVLTAKEDIEDLITDLIGSAPEVLDTLAELADAIGDDPDFFNTINNELDQKVDKVSGKGLSTNDYTTEEKDKLAGILAGAQVNPTNVSAFTNDAGYLTQHQDISGKEDVTTIVAPVNATDATLPVTSLTTEAGKYYRLDVPVETLAITLPAMDAVTSVKTVVIYLTAGTTPAVTITAQDGKKVLYQDGYEIEADKTYGINAIFNGDAWVVDALTIKIPPFFVKLTLNNGEVVELQGSGELTKAMVSDQYKGTLVSAEIGELCTSIGKDAFSWCSGLTSVTIPNSVTSISQNAFLFCSGLNSINIPNSVTSIGDGAFNLCTSLTSITISDSVTSIGISAFNLCTSLTSITISDSVTSIGSYAFQSCESLTDVTIPGSVTSIGNSTFANCTGLTSIIVDSTNTVYDSRDNCNALINTSTNELISGCKNTVIPNTVTSLGISAFDNCAGLTSITIPDSVTSIGKSAFYGCTGLTSIIIPDSVTSIGKSAFQGCRSLTSIICNAMTAPTIKYDTFKNVKTGGTLTVPNGSTGYDVWMGTGDYYLGKYNWTKVEPKPMNIITYEATAKLTETTGQTSPGLHTNAFSGNSGQLTITSHTFENGIGTIEFDGDVTSIGMGTFFRCTGLTSITIPDSVTSIGTDAFMNCSGLTSITIPDSVTSIGQYAFNSCSSLTSITIPSGVTSIGQYAFCGCTGLTSITCNATTAPSIQNNTFQDVETGGTLTVPNGSTGYDVWMGTGNYYLGKYNWTKVEQ